MRFGKKKLRSQLLIDYKSNYDLFNGSSQLFYVHLVFTLDNAKQHGFIEKNDSSKDTLSNLYRKLNRCFCIIGYFPKQLSSATHIST